MKKILLFGATLMMAAVSMAQTPTVSASSVTFKYCQTTEGTAVKQVGKDAFSFTWLGETFTTYGSKVVTLTNARGCDSLVTLTVTQMEGALPYAFSVSATKKVYFSKGNLQYCANPSSGSKTHQTLDGNNTQGIWRFAPNQTDRYASGNTSRSSSSSLWIDLFKFGTSGYKGLMPWTTTYYDYTSSNYSAYSTTTNYSKTPLDWGWYNAISNGGNQPGVWFMLTNAEWEYLNNTRTNASSKRGTATINGIKGQIYLPDNWSNPSGVNYVPNNNNYTDYTSVWSLMEARGAVFLPNAGSGVNGDGYAWREWGYNTDYPCYWTSTRCATNSANYKVRTGPNGGVGNEYPAYNFYAVRLVRLADN